MTAFYLAAFLTISGVVALILKIIQIPLKRRKVSNTVADWADQLLYDFTRAGIRFYVKGAQWVGSAMLVLILIGTIGLVALAILHKI